LGTVIQVFDRPSPVKSPVFRALSYVMPMDIEVICPSIPMLTFE
jgi:hypothetical protein